MKRLCTIVAILAAAVSVSAQDSFYSMFNYSGFIPDVRINDRVAPLQEALYPEFYFTNSAVSDMRWVREYDSVLTDFWNSQGDTILHVMSDLAGIEWRETEFDIYLVRYFPSTGAPSPLILPLGGIKRGEIIEAMPTDHRMKFNLLFQLARRMLDQTVQPRHGENYAIAFHPLMRYGPYRRDNLATTLTLATAQAVMGLDSADAALESAFWEQHHPGLRIFKEYFQDSWVLTPDRTLADWLRDEPYGSHLVAVTRPPERPKSQYEQRPRRFVEGLPIKGRLGMAVSIDENGMLKIDTLDTYRLAYASGLRQGDVIRSVNGYRVHNQKQVVERILQSLDAGGATLEILRDGDMRTVIMRPMNLLTSPEEDYYGEDYYRMLDSLRNDTIPDSLQEELQQKQ